MTFIISAITAAGVNQQSRQLMLNNAFQISQGLANQSVYPVLSGAKENALDAIKQVLGFPSVKAVRLTSVQGDTFASQGQLPTTLKLSGLTETKIINEQEQHWLIASPIKIIDLDTSEDEGFAFEEEQAQTSDIIGYAEVLVSKEILLATQARVTLFITISGVVSVILLGYILNFGLKRLFNPLYKLADTMDEAKQSGEHLFAEVQGAKEIRMMANSYNNMMEVLDKQDDELRLHRDTLEKEVQIRTREIIVARDAALTASRHKSEFMANISHELRTPIQSIIGYSEIVIEELELEGNFELIDDIEKVEKNAQRLLMLINGLLDLAKIEAGHLDVNLISFSLAELKQNMMDTIAPLSKQNNNTFSIDDQSQLTTVTQDKEKLEQALLNLLSNACKFTNDGNVKLLISNDANNLYFQVQDTGIGLTKEQQDYIFDAFKQVDGSQSRKFGGTGLGLAITKKFVELMQGTIRVNSEQNQGSRFTISVPIVKTT
ncbi:sensor histidine kinase [Saccharobesus litoralis]|nr:ATP-binding protein [Saccharobesus litoralis]